MKPSLAGTACRDHEMHFKLAGYERSCGHVCNASDIKHPQQHLPHVVAAAAPLVYSTPTAWAGLHDSAQHNHRPYMLCYSSPSCKQGLSVGPSSRRETPHACCGDLASMHGGSGAPWR